MKALAWITVTLCFVYGVIAVVIYQTTPSMALEESKSLQMVEARVESIQRCPGKSLCYFTVATYQLDGKNQTAKINGEFGKEGMMITIWSKPGSSKGYESPSSYIERSTAFLPLLLIPGSFIIFPILLAFQSKRDETEKDNTGNLGQSA